MWNMDYYFLSKKDREVKFKTVFYQDTLPNDFISKDDVSAKYGPVASGCP